MERNNEGTSNRVMKYTMVGLIATVFILILMLVLRPTGTKSDVKGLEKENKELQGVIDSLELSVSYRNRVIGELSNERVELTNKLASIDSTMNLIPEKYEDLRNDIDVGDTSRIIDILSNY